MYKIIVFSIGLIFLGSSNLSARIDSPEKILVTETHWNSLPSAEEKAGQEKGFSDLDPLIDNFRRHLSKKEFEKYCVNFVHPFFAENMGSNTCKDFLSTIRMFSGNFKRGEKTSLEKKTLYAGGQEIEALSVTYGSVHTIHDEEYETREEIAFSKGEDGTYKLSNYENRKVSESASKPLSRFVNTKPLLDKFMALFNSDQFSELCQQLVHQEFIYGIETCPDLAQSVKAELGIIKTISEEERQTISIMVKSGFVEGVKTTVVSDFETDAYYLDFTFSYEKGILKLSDFF